MWDAIVSALTLVVNYAKGLSGLGTMGIISATVMLLVSLWKSSALQPYWAQLPAWAQRWLGPVLGVLLALASLQNLSWNTILLGLQGGALAAAVNALLDTLKLIPGLNSVWVTIINFIEGVLQAPTESKSIKGKL